MALTERLALVITGDASGAVRAIRQVGDAAARDLDKAQTQFDKTGLRLQQMGSAALGAGTLMIAGLSRAAQTAGNLEQAIGGTEAVFGNAADVIDRFARDSARSMGLSEREFREATTRLGGSLKGLGFDTQEAAERAVELTQVASDLAATYGGTTKDAVDALAAAFRGEADPAERFNLFLNQQRVNAKAVELGLAQTTAQVDAHAKAQATLALVMEQSVDAQGQFARESDTLIGRQQIMRAEFENASAELGRAFMPVMQRAAEITRFLVGGFSDLNEATGGLLSQLAAVGSVGIVGLGGLSFTVGTVMRSMDTLRSAAQRVREAFVMVGEAGTTSMTRLSAAVGTAGAVGAIFALAGALDQVLNKSKDVTEVVSELSRVSDEQLVRSFQHEFKLLIALKGEAKAFEIVAKENLGTAQRLADALEAQGHDVSQLRRVIEQETEAQRRANADTERATTLVEGAGDAAEGTEENINRLTQSLLSGAPAALEFGESMRAAFESVFGLERVSVDVDSAIREFTESMSSTDRATRTMSRGVDLVAEKQRALKDATQQAESALESFTSASEQLQAAQQDLLDAQRRLDEALRGPTDRERAEAADEFAEARLSLEDATFAVEDAETQLQEAQRRGDPREIARAQNDLEQALLRRNRAQRQLADSQERYNQIANWTAETDTKVAEANSEVEDAQKRVEKATRETARRYGELLEAQRHQQEVQNASLASFANTDRAMYNTRLNAIDTRNEFLRLAESITDATARLLELQTVSQQGKLEELNRIRDLVRALPSLTPEQRNRLLAIIYSAQASALGFTKGFMPFAEGGIVRGGRGGIRALIGEGSRDEAVIPLPFGWRNMAGGRQQIHITINTLSSSGVEEAVVQALKNAQRRGFTTLAV